jgi:hypothetical protein
MGFADQQVHVADEWLATLAALTIRRSRGNIGCWASWLRSGLTYLELVQEGRDAAIHGD